MEVFRLNDKSSPLLVKTNLGLVKNFKKALGSFKQGMIELLPNGKFNKNKNKINGKLFNGHRLTFGGSCQKNSGILEYLVHQDRKEVD